MHAKLRRRNKKIHSLKYLLSSLKDKGCHSDNLEKVIKSNFSGLPLELILNQAKNEKSKKKILYNFNEAICINTIFLFTKSLQVPAKFITFITTSIQDQRLGVFSQM